MKTVLLVLTLGSLIASIYFTINRVEFSDRIKRISIADDHNREEISYTGTLRLNTDETAIDSISPGGYLSYQKNEVSLKIKSNREGILTYTINDRTYPPGEKPADDQVIREAIQEMIAYGFNAAAHLNHLYNLEGSKGVLTAIPALKNDQIKQLYMQQLFAANDLNDSAMATLVQEVGKLNSSQVRSGYLVRFSPRRLRDSTLLYHWLNVAANLFAGPEKQQALQHLMGENILAYQGFTKVLAIIRSLPVDTEKVTAARLLMIQDVNSEAQWKALIELAVQIRSGHDKSWLLSHIEEKMPENEELAQVYRNAIHSFQ